MAAPRDNEETPDQPDYTADSNDRPGNTTDEPAPDFLDRPISDFEDGELDKLWRLHDPEGHAAMQRAVQPIIEKALAKTLRNLDNDFADKVIGKQFKLPPSVWETWAKANPEFFSPALNETLARHFASFDTNLAYAVTENPTRHLDPAAAMWLDTARTFADPGALPPVPELPDISETVRKQLDARFASLNEQLKDLAFPPAFLDSVKKLSEPYAKSLPFAHQDPLPFLKRFNNDFLVLYASMVLSASRVENLLADLADVLLPDEELAGLSAAAHSYGDDLLSSIAENDECDTCAGIAKELAKPFVARNTYVHAKWKKVGKDVASKEEKARRALELTLSPDTVVIQRKPMGKKKLKALVDKWEHGEKDAFDALFRSEVVSLGLVAALSETFTEAGDALEKELTDHENEQGAHTNA